MGAAPQAREVGPVYDLLLGTRDGVTLPCRNKDGQIVNVAQVAYMGTIDRNQGQREETELQHKDELVQLGSSNIIDRELTNWPQVTQGDWSGGMLQRVFSGPGADPTRYWEGDGVLWPISDYLPQRPAQFAPFQAEGGAVMKGIFFIGTPAGSISSIGMSYAFLYTTTVGTIATNLVIINGDTRYTITNPTGIATGNGSPSAPQTPAEFMIGAGALWYVVPNGANTEIRFVTVGSPTTTLFDTIAASSPSLGNNNCAIGYVGNKVYLAVPYLNNANPTTRIRIYEIQAGVATSFTELFLADTTTVLGSSDQLNVASTVFVGDTLYYTIQTGSGDAIIVAYSLVATSFSTVAMLPGEGQLFLTAAAGVIFVVSGGGNMYLLQGGSLQHIGPLPPQIGPVTISPGTQANAFSNSNSLSRAVAFGPYAVFAASYYPPGASVSIVAVYAYDVLRGRLFRLGILSNLARNVAMGGARIGLMTFATRTLAGGVAITPQWSIVAPILSVSGLPLDVSNAQILDVGLRRLNFASTQLGFQVTSSIIDFTSSQPKLYRDIPVTYLPLQADASCGVQVDAWLDRDPASLSPTPDFTTSVFGDAGPGSTRLVLPINTISTKLVCRVTTYGGQVVGTSLLDAPKLVSAIVRVATGWVQTLKLELAPQLQSNSKNVQDVWTYQGIDNVVAYNFLRQLWRLKGGQCVIALPNGDTGNWQMEDGQFDSPKPFGAVFRADQASGFKWVATIKIREDID